MQEILKIQEDIKKLIFIKMNIFPVLLVHSLIIAKISTYIIFPINTNNLRRN
jgi:hypothetical protein